MKFRQQQKEREASGLLEEEGALYQGGGHHAESSAAALELSDGEIEDLLAMENRGAGKARGMVETLQDALKVRTTTGVGTWASPLAVGRS